MMASDTGGNLIKLNGITLLISLLALSSITFSIGLYSKSLLVGKNEILDQILFNEYSKVKEDISDSITSVDEIKVEGEDDEDDDDDDEDEEDGGSNKIFPASGVHLGVEFHNVKDISNYLNKGKVSNSLVNIIDKTPMKLLSYHCSSSKNMNNDQVTCFGILEHKSHIFIHTYVDPDTGGTIAIDMLACDETQLMLVNKVLPMLYDEFSLDNNDKLQNTKWKAFLRNSPEEDLNAVRHFCYDDLCAEYLAWKNKLKTEIASVESQFQRIDVWDVVNPKTVKLDSYFKSLSKNEESYESLHPELYRPERVIFLDGVSQSLSKGMEAYHEALVQPAMFAHPNPKRVAIIGGGEGATLKEALKHKSVSNVTMIDIDEVMCKVSADVLYPLWNGCDDFMEDNVPSSCFDHPRAHVQYEDALAWFIDRFSEDNGIEKYDVVIMDALDPQDNVEFANILYQDMTFWKSVYNSITDDGILVAQLGNSPYIDDGADKSNKNKRRAAIIEVLHNVGFQTTHSYEESHGGFDDPWTFLIVCKSHKCHDNWYANPAQVELEIQKRILPSKSNEPLLKHFDGATMHNYRIPHKGLEVVYCRKVPTPIECQMIDYNSHKTHRYFENNQDDATLHHMGTSIPISMQSLLSAYQKDHKEKKGGDDDKDKATNQLLPIITKLTGPLSVERVGYYLKSCPLTLLSNNDMDIDSVCALQVQENESNITSLSSATTSTTNTLFYSPALDRHIPLFGHLGNHKRG